MRNEIFAVYSVFHRGSCSSHSKGKLFREYYSRRAIVKNNCLCKKGTAESRLEEAIRSSVLLMFARDERVACRSPEYFWRVVYAVGYSGRPAALSLNAISTVLSFGRVFSASEFQFFISRMFRATLRDISSPLDKRRL